MEWVKKFRILTFALIFSGALNIGLIAAFVANALKDDTSVLSYKPAMTNVSDLSTLSFKELVAQLTNREPVADGYTKRDLALAALVADHHFDIDRAIGAGFSRCMIGGVEMFPGLSEEQFEGIIRFAYKEKWPLKAKGLFAQLQKPTRDASLEQAFSHTPEFYALALLFQKSGAPQENGTLMQLVSEGSWSLLEHFAKEQAEHLDLTPDKRRKLLLNYLAEHSKTAARLLLKTDLAFSAKRLDESLVNEILSLLEPAETENFRSAMHVAVAPVEQKAQRMHTVAEGESLWKISRTYKVPVDEIVQLNGIDKDKLYPGMNLKIPN